MSKTQAAFVSSLPCDQIQIREGFNPRKELGDLTELKASIKAQGLINPVAVCADGAGGYFLVAGARRLAACMQLGHTDLMVTIHTEFDIDSPEAKGMALAENLEGGRQNLSDMDLANAYLSIYNQVKDQYKDEKSRNTAVGKLAGGVSFKAVEHSRKLLDAPASIQDKLSKGELSKAAVTTLVSVPEEIKDRVAQRVSDTEGSLTEADVKRVAKTIQQEDRAQVVDLEADDLEEDSTLTSKDLFVWQSKTEVKLFIKQFCIDALEWKKDGDKEKEIFCLGAAAALMWASGRIDQPQYESREFRDCFKTFVA
jgi:ParB/RepB/Spo0J family partition protein